MARFTIPRRTILRGAGGAALALPVLDVMRGARAQAAVAPKRFVLAFGGISLANTYRKDRGRFDFVTPLDTGPNYEIPRALESIRTEGVQAEMGLVSGLTIPWGSSAMGTLPPGGTEQGVHGGGVAPQLAGTTVYSEHDGPVEEPRGPSCDQLVVDPLAGASTHRTLPLSVMANSSNNGYTVGTLSYGTPSESSPRDKRGRPIARAIPSINSPEVAYQKLFGEPITGDGGQTSLAADLLLRRRSVVDAVSRWTDLLVKRVGAEDRRLLERHLDHIRALEQQIASLSAESFSKCKLPKPVKDPPPGHWYQQSVKDGVVTGEIYDTGSGWSEETLRAQMQADMIHTALACDLTRVVTWYFTPCQSKLNLVHISGDKTDMHGASHDYSENHNPKADSVGWHVSHLARLVKLLRDTPDIGDTRMIDNTVLLMFFEGGWGRLWDPPGNLRPPDPVLNKDYLLGARESHSTENMVVIMAGGKNLGLQTGQHIHFNNDRHPGQVMLTAIRALGHGGPLGELTQTLPEMLKI